MITKIAHTAMKVTDMDVRLLLLRRGGVRKAFELPDARGIPGLCILKICDGAFLELFYGGEKTGIHLCVRWGGIPPLDAFQVGVTPAAKAFERAGSDLRAAAGERTGTAASGFTTRTGTPGAGAVPPGSRSQSIKDPMSTERGADRDRPGAFTVSDMEQALAFYREKLGFALIESLKDEVFLRPRWSEPIWVGRRG